MSFLMIFFNHHLHQLLTMATKVKGKGEESHGPHQRNHNALTKTVDGLRGERDSQRKGEGEDTTKMLCVEMFFNHHLYHL
jgi:hypothetical protein